jgi:uncharacterized protein (DUF1800 family)
MKKPALCAAAVAALLMALPATSSTKKSAEAEEAKRQAKLFQKKLNKDEQILHALDRLTFGPRPGDVERAKKIGLKKWIDLQLHPERISESPDLEAKLEPLESLRMTPMDAVQHYPPPQLLRAIAEGRQPMPEDPVLRATVARFMLRLKVKKGEAAAPGAIAPDPNADMEPAKPLSEVLEPAELQTLRSGTQDQKRELLQSLPPDKMEDMLIALPRPLRQQLFAFAPTNIRRQILLLNAPQQVVAYDLLSSKLLRAIESNRQLAEQLDDFWFNHFNVFYDKGSDRFLIPDYERAAIRPYVLGKFRDLLEATAKSPAMLFYLDNFESVRPDLDANTKRRVKRGLNENYGRELMELHTLGVNGGYTQKDVTEVARCFTGWTILEPRRGGGFFYNDKVHDKGEKVVLGHVIPAGGGMDDGEKVLDILAQHPATAHFISQEIAQRFVADNPPEALVDRMAKTFLATGGDIREVMKTLLNSKEFWSEGAYRAKVKSPFEMVVSALRALNANVTDAFALANQVGNLGEPLYRKLEPTGYPNTNAEWVNSAALLGRMNFALQLAQNRVPGAKVDLSGFGDDPQEVAKTLTFRTASPQTRAAINKALEDKKQKSPGLVAGLVIGSPDFQRR